MSSKTAPTKNCKMLYMNSVFYFAMAPVAVGDTLENVFDDYPPLTVKDNKQLQEINKRLKL